jgi:hypothetical protein
MAVYNKDTPNFPGEIHAAAVTHIKFLSDVSVVTGGSDGAVLQVLRLSLSLSLSLSFSLVLC